MTDIGVETSGQTVEVVGETARLLEQGTVIREFAIKELPEKFVHWQIEYKRGIYDAIEKDQYIAFNAGHLPVVGTVGETLVPNLANKGVGFTPRDEYLDHYLGLVASAVERIQALPPHAVDETRALRVETAREFCVNVGKTVAVAEDFPAFIVNRILMPMINEAIYTLYEGVGTVEAIDTAMRLGAHHPMGPLQLADFIGLDTCLSVMQMLYEGLADSKYRPCPLLVKYVEAGWLGRKTKRGFYDYRGEKPMPTR